MITKLYPAAFSIALLAALSSCGPSVSVRAGTGTSTGGGGSPSNEGGTSVTETSESYSYSFEYNECKTGKQVADSREGYCKNLKDNELNHGCAEWMRKDAFDKGCNGTGLSWESASSFDANDIPTAEEFDAEQS